MAVSNYTTRPIESTHPTSTGAVISIPSSGSFSSWVELRAAAVGGIQIEGLSFNGTLGVTYVCEIGTGPAGSEVAKTGSVHAIEGLTNGGPRHLIRFVSPLRVPTNTRVAVRVKQLGVQQCDGLAKLQFITLKITHTTTGALTQQAHTLAGTARRFRAHPTTGGLTQQAHTLAGTARRFRAHPTNGNLICSVAAVAGTAKHNKPHPTSGALTQQAHTLAGTAHHTPNHQTSGTPAAQPAAVSGSALHRYKHTTTGDLTQQAHTLAGTARRFRTHAATGTLASAASLVDGAARHQSRHPTIGALTQQAHSMTGTANRFRAHPSGGTPAAQAATIAGTARHNQPHLTTGTPSAQSAVVAGTARHQSKHTTTGDLTQQAHTLAGTARRFRAHAATGALAAQPSGVFGDAWKPQRLRPASDVSDGTWLTESEGSNLWDSINEPLPVNPADFIYTLGTSLCEVLLDPGTAPAADTEHTVLYEARGNGVADMKVQLKQGAAVIAEWTETAVPVAATRYTHTLTVPQAASITDYTDLRLVFETLP